MSGTLSRYIFARMAIYIRFITDESRFLKMYAQNEVSLDRTQSSRESTKERCRSVYFGILSLLLFDTLHTCMNELETLYVDGTVAYAAWCHLIKKKQEGWEKAMIYVRLIRSS